MSEEQQAKGGLSPKCGCKKHCFYTDSDNIKCPLCEIDRLKARVAELEEQISEWNRTFEEYSYYRLSSELTKLTNDAMQINYNRYRTALEEIDIAVRSGWGIGDIHTIATEALKGGSDE